MDSNSPSQTNSNSPSFPNLDEFGDGMIGNGEPSSSGNLVMHQLPAFPTVVHCQLPSPTVNLQQAQAMKIEARHNGNQPNHSLQTGRYAKLTNNHIFVPNEISALVRGPWQKFLSRFSKPDQGILKKLHRKQQCLTYSTSNRAKKIK